MVWQKKCSINMFQTKFGIPEFDVNLLRGSTCCQPCRIALQPKGPREDLALQRASKPQKFKQNHNLCQSDVAATVSKRKSTNGIKSYHKPSKKKLTGNFPPNLHIVTIVKPCIPLLGSSNFQFQLPPVGPPSIICQDPQDGSGTLHEIHLGYVANIGEWICFNDKKNHLQCPICFSKFKQ